MYVVAATTAAVLLIGVLARRSKRRGEAGAVSLEAVVITGVLVLGALTVGTILVRKATDRANAIPTDTPAVTTIAP